MSSIWNPQDRYLLSNMTSEKLYAKSPLTTGVSGTSAYIGLEPSATYNETVLYSVTGNPTRVIKNQVSSYTLSESCKNFESIKLNFVCSYGWWDGIQKVNTIEIPVTQSYTGFAGTCDYWALDTLYDFNKFAISGTNLSISGFGRYKVALNGSAAADLTARGVGLLSVIGINRKEV